MRVFSIASFVASWLLFCTISQLCSGAEVPYRSSYQANDPEYQFQPLQYEAASIEERSRVSIPEPPEKPNYNVHYDYRSNAVHSGIPSKNIYPDDDAMKPNVAKPVPEYLMGKELGKPRHKFSGSKYVENQQVLKKERDVQFPPHKTAQGRDEEITKKLDALEKYLSEDNNENNVEGTKSTIEDKNIAGIPEEMKRVVRQVRRQRPGFFWTLARLAFETFNDTRSAVQQISSVINENVVSDAITRPPVTSNSLVVTDATTSSNDQSNMPSNVAGVNVTTMRTTTTTTGPPKLTRTGLQNLITRNLRGLVRIFNIEWQDALNQSEANVREFQRNLGNQVGGFLQDNPNAF